MVSIDGAMRVICLGLGVNWVFCLMMLMFDAGEFDNYYVNVWVLVFLVLNCNGVGCM